MQHTQRRWLRGITLAACLFYFGFTPEQSRALRLVFAQAADEAALRALAEEFFAAYAKRDLAGVVRLWSTRSPDLESRKQAMQQLFANHEKIEVKNLTVLKATVDGANAKLRVDVEMSALEAKTGKPAAGLGGMMRALHCVKESNEWRMWREIPAVEDLAERLVAAKTEQERTALLAEERELATVDLRKAMNTQGNRLKRQGNYPQALTIFRLAQSLAEQIGDKAGIASALHNSGNVYYLQGNYAQALEHFQKSLELSEALGDKEVLAGVLISMGNVSFSQGSYVQALEYYQKGLTLEETLGDKETFSGVLTSIGNVRYLQGSYAEALEVYQKSLMLSEASKDRTGIARTLNNIGNIHFAQGNYALALELYQKSLTLTESLEDKAWIADALNNIGGVHLLQGNYTHALEHYQKSLTLKEALGDKTGIARTLNNIGSVNRLQGNYAQALEHYQRSLTLREALGSKAGVALALNNIGIVYSARGNYAQALEHYEKSLTLREALGDRAGIADTLNAIGNANRLEGNYAQALDFANRAMVLAKQFGYADPLWRAQLAAGRSYRALNRLTQARQAFEEAIATVETLRAQVAGGEQERQRFFEDKLSSYHAMVELLVAQNQTSEAFTHAERAKARVLLDVLHSGRVNITKAMTTQEQEQEHRLNNQLVLLNTQIYRENLRPQPSASRLNELKAQLQKARLDYEAFQISLYAAHPGLKAQRGEVQPLTLAQASDLLPDAQSGLLEFAVTDDRTFLFVLTKTKPGDQTPVELKVYSLEIKRKDLAERAARFRESLAKRDLGFRQSARELYDLLLKPAQAQLEGKTSLVIVPDEALWELPFQTLQLTPTRYLLEDYAISYAPSLTVLREMISLRSKKALPAPGSSTLLAFGNPALGKQTVQRVKSVLMDEKLDPLPEAEREVNTLRRIYGPAQSKVYIGSEAREERAKAEAGNYRILHLATHGILNDRSPMYSHVLLAQTESSASEDGLLEAWEILKLDLKADLVVLAACETARGRVGAGEGMIGLSWALFVAGCPTTVVSQWKVESSSTTELMVEFHRRLRGRLEDGKAPTVSRQERCGQRG